MFVCTCAWQSKFTCVQIFQQARVMSLVLCLCVYSGHFCMPGIKESQKVGSALKIGLQIIESFQEIKLRSSGWVDSACDHSEFSSAQI